MRAEGELQERTPLSNSHVVDGEMFVLVVHSSHTNPTWTMVGHQARTETVRTGAGTHQFTSLGLALGLPRRRMRLESR